MDVFARTNLLHRRTRIAYIGVLDCYANEPTYYMDELPDLERNLVDTIKELA